MSADVLHNVAGLIGYKDDSCNETVVIQLKLLYLYDVILPLMVGKQPLIFLVFCHLLNRFIEDTVIRERLFKGLSCWFLVFYADEANARSFCEKKFFSIQYLQSRTRLMR